MTGPHCSGGQPDHSHDCIASNITESDGHGAPSHGIIAQDTSCNATTSEMVTGREHLFRRTTHIAQGKDKKEGEEERSELVCPALKSKQALLATAGE